MDMTIINTTVFNTATTAVSDMTWLVTSDSGAMCGVNSSVFDPDGVGSVGTGVCTPVSYGFCREGDLAGRLPWAAVAAMNMVC